MLASAISGRLANLVFSQSVVCCRFAAVHPVDEAEGPHVLGAQHLLVRQAEILQRLGGMLRDVDGQHLIGGQGAVLQRIAFVARLAEIARRAGAGVDDHRAAGLDRRQIDLERRRIEGDQEVGLVAGGLHTAGAEIDLERRHAVGGPDGCTDLGGEVGEGREIVADHRRRKGELAARQLNAVAGIAGEADDDRFDLAPLRGGTLLHVHNIMSAMSVSKIL